MPGSNDSSSGSNGSNTKPVRHVDYSLWRDPSSLAAVPGQHPGRVLDPATALTIDGIRPFPTVYIGPRILISKRPGWERQLERLNAVAAGLGWALTEDRPNRPRSHQELPGRGVGQGSSRRPSSSDCRCWTVRLTVSVPGGAPDPAREAPLAPDGWVLLQNARIKYGIEEMRGVGLDHVMFIRSIDPSPYHDSNPTTTRTPITTPIPSARAQAVATYGLPGSVAASRSPMSVRPCPAAATTRSPAAGRSWPSSTRGAVTTTGSTASCVATCDAGSRDRLHRRGLDPERYPDQTGASTAASIRWLITDFHLRADPTGVPGRGHPRLASRRIRRPHRRVGAGELLRLIAELVWRALGDPTNPDEPQIDVLNLSMGYYHETPTDQQFDSTMYEILRLIAEAGPPSWCSAGNDATARPMFPRPSSRGSTARVASGRATSRHRWSRSAR